MIKLVIFDFDGPIIDSFIACFNAGKLNDPELTQEEYRNMFTGNIFDALEKRKSKVPPQDTGVDHYIEQFNQRLAIKPIEGIEEVLRTIHKKGTKTIIISSSPTGKIKEYVQTHGIGVFFDGIFGSDIEKSKSKKFEMVAVQYGVAPAEMIFITDTLGDIREAEKHSIITIAVTWGFHTQEMLKEGKPHYIVHTPKELSEIVTELLNA